LEAYLLRANEVDMRVQTTRCQNQSFAGNAFSGYSDNHSWRNVHHVGVSRFADA
jgi:hypothetical protein